MILESRRARMRCHSYQNGTFAILTALMLIIIVAPMLRFLLAAAEANSASTVPYHQSLQSFLIADSGAEIALAKLSSAGIPACALGALPSGALVGGTLQFMSASPLINVPVDGTCNQLNVANGCRVQALGSIGQSSRTVNLDVAYCNSQYEGVTGHGGYTTDIVQKINASAAKTIVITTLTYLRKNNGGGGNASTTTCTQSGVSTGNCAIGWDITSSSGLPSVGSRGAVAQMASAGDYFVTQKLDGDRNFVGVGGLFEGNGITYVGSYSNDKGPMNKGTVGHSNNVQGQIPDGRSSGKAADGSNGWCHGADTLVFGFSGRGTVASDGLTGVTFGVANTPLRLLARYVSMYDDAYTEIWYLYKGPSTGGIDSLFTSGANDFFITKNSSGTTEWAAGFTCLKNADPLSPRNLTLHMRPVNWWEPF